MTKASWIKGKKRMTGYWKYQWASARFIIVLDSKDPVTGRQRELITAADKPEFNGWKLAEEARDG